MLMSITDTAVCGADLTQAPSEETSAMIQVRDNGGLGQGGVDEKERNWWVLSCFRGLGDRLEGWVGKGVSGADCPVSSLAASGW